MAHEVLPDALPVRVVFLAALPFANFIASIRSPAALVIVGGELALARLAVSYLLGIGVQTREILINLVLQTLGYDVAKPKTNLPK
ncbi:MAG: hypothetical protein QGF71_06690 [Rhodospirillales bacterium]|nr:hypothetical protein [Rhodospirillales bacterium]